MQCEPREITEVFCSEDHAKFIQYCYDTRLEMPTKIQNHDKKKAANATATMPKVQYVEENDWWVQNGN